MRLRFAVIWCVCHVNVQLFLDITLKAMRRASIKIKKKTHNTYKIMLIIEVILIFFSEIHPLLNVKKQDKAQSKKGHSRQNKGQKSHKEGKRKEPKGAHRSNAGFLVPPARSTPYGSVRMHYGYPAACPGRSGQTVAPSAGAVGSSQKEATH